MAVNKPKDQGGRCARCACLLAGPYGEAGVALSRKDNATLLCSGCGLIEALEDYGRDLAPGGSHGELD
jgi:hypothetical protein